MYCYCSTGTYITRAAPGVRHAIVAWLRNICAVGFDGANEGNHDRTGENYVRSFGTERFNGNHSKGFGNMYCCRDAGEAAIAAKVELVAKAALVLMSMPVFTSLMETAGELLSL